MKNATTCYNDSMFGKTLVSWMTDSQSLKKVIIPKFNTSAAQGKNFMKNMTNLILCDIRNCDIRGASSNSAFSNTPNLIDIIYGNKVSDSTNLLNRWNPTNAFLEDTNSLVTDAQDEFGNPITNNKQQLLYNIRRHIAALLRTDVGNKTITFYADVKAAIQADPITLAAFPSNWTIA